MGTITPAPTLVGGTVAYAADVMSLVNDIVAEFNGGIDNVNIRSGAGIATDRMADLAITAAKLASNAVETAKIKDANVTAVKLADDTATYEGQGCNLSELFTEADQAWANPSETTNQAQHGGKTIWGWFYTSSTSPVTFDESIDWRYRLITVHQWAYDVASADDFIPNGSNSGQVGGQPRFGQWQASGGAVSVNQWTNWGIGYSFSGLQFLSLDGSNITGSGIAVDWHVASADGKLQCDCSGAPTNDYAVLAMVSCSPYIGAP